MANGACIGLKLEFSARLMITAGAILVWNILSLWNYQTGSHVFARGVTFDRRPRFFNRMWRFLVWCDFRSKAEIFKPEVTFSHMTSLPIKNWYFQNRIAVSEIFFLLFERRAVFPVTTESHLDTLLNSMLSSPTYLSHCHDETPS